MSRPVAEVIAAELAAAGVDMLFGLPGGGPNLDLVGASADVGVRFVLTHTETAAAIMAGTYGLLRGTVGASLCTRGPGLASAVNGMAQATLDRFPLVLFADAVPSAHPVPHQRLDQLRVSEAVSVAHGVGGGGDAAVVVRDALVRARTAPRGAVHLDVDASASASFLTVASRAAAAAPHRGEAVDRAALARLVDRLGSARRPVVIAGLDALDASAAVRSLVAALGCPALVTYQAAGMIPHGASAYGGLFTNGASERPLLDQADLVVAVGVDPVEPIPGPWRGAAPVLELAAVDHDAPFFPAAERTVAPLGPLLDALNTALTAPGRGAPASAASRWPADAGRRHDDAVRAALRRSASAALGPDRVVEAVAAALPQARATVDAGAHFLVAMPLWPAAEPNDVLISNGLATMGFALPAAIGAALAEPDRAVVCFVGDGGLSICLGELETLARLGLDVTVVVLNDATLSLIALKQGPAHGGAAAVRFGPVDYAQIAGGFGISAHVVDDEESLGWALSAGGRGPRLIDARVDPAVYSSALQVTRG